MSNNARVVASHNGLGEIGSAQYFQALACFAEPDVRMNPLLLKPEADTHSQVVLLGEVNHALTQTPWRERSEKVWPYIANALDALRENNDVVVIEGAGSPAEINLMDSDVVNLRVARHADARCLLVADIDKGGAFAHLYGTWALLSPKDQARISGFVLNKFRGDVHLLAPAPQMLEELTHIPTVAVLPMWWKHGLPEEDGVFDDRNHASGPITKTVAVIAYPRISNLDEFQPLKNVPGLRLIWARAPSDLAGLGKEDWIILPGSKQTSSDLEWLRSHKLDQCIVEHANRGNFVLGICGGLQILGEALIDQHGVDGNAAGLGLLSLVTIFESTKTVKRTSTQLNQVRGVLSALSGLAVSGYEIHHGQTTVHKDMSAKGARVHEVAVNLAWQNDSGNVTGIYLHGLFENPEVLKALFGAETITLESVFDGLADFLGQHMSTETLQKLIA
jgi:adenosylcobyric acid synthase